MSRLRGAGSFTHLLTLLALLSSCWALSIDKVPRLQDLSTILDAARADDTKGLMKRADANLAGYLGVFFLGADPYVYFYLSNGNNAISFKALNRGSPVMRPTKGTGGVRDPTIVKGGGAEEGQKWYIIGTDLHIGKTSWDAAQRSGSKGIFIWDSTDLINWGNERLVVVEDSSAGMVWAPEAIWDPAKGMPAPPLPLVRTSHSTKLTESYRPIPCPLGFEIRMPLSPFSQTSPST